MLQGESPGFWILKGGNKKGKQWINQEQPKDQNGQ